MTNEQAWTSGVLQHVSKGAETSVPNLEHQLLFLLLHLLFDENAKFLPKFYNIANLS
jgi:hypothetical protein